MSTPGSPPSFVFQKIGWVNLVSLALFIGAIAGTLIWALCGAPSFWKFTNASVVHENRWETLHGQFVENGRVYDQATVELAGVTELILPADRNPPAPTLGVTPEITVALRTDGEPGVVRVLLEKRQNYYGHPPESMPLIDIRERYKVWKRQAGTALVLDVDAGYRTIEGGTTIRVTFVLPPNFPVRREPVSGPFFAGRYEGGWPVANDKAKAAGWEEVPQRPFPNRQFR